MKMRARTAKYIQFGDRAPVDCSVSGASVLAYEGTFSGSVFQPMFTNLNRVLFAELSHVAGDGPRDEHPADLSAVQPQALLRAE